MTTLETPTRDLALFDRLRGHAARSAPTDADAAVMLARCHGAIDGAEETVRAYLGAGGDQVTPYEAAVNELAYQMVRAAAMVLAAQGSRESLPTAGPQVDDLVRRLDRLASGAAPGDLFAYFDAVPDEARDELDRAARRLDGR